MHPTFEQAARKGFVFPGARAWITPGSGAALAQDAALITTPEAAVPVELLAYVDPSVVEIMTAPRRAREIFAEQKKGDWTTPYMKWRADETTGTTAAYSDYGQSGAAGVNFAWLTRAQYVYQTVVSYGDLETALSAEARIDLAAAKQRAAANILDVDANRFSLLGVEGREIYGILNDPDLPPAITPDPVGAGTPATAWSGKDTVQIYNDVRRLFAELVRRTAGFVDEKSDLVLALSPALAVHLGNATGFGVTVMDMLDRYFQRLSVVTLPELGNAASGETALLIAREINGQPTGLLAFGEKIRAGRLAPGLSSLSQKFTASTYGGVVLRPMGFAQMTGL